MASARGAGSKGHGDVYNRGAFTAAVSSPGGATPTGSVTISEGATIYGSGTLVSGKALISTSSIPVGVHEIRGTYGGDGTHSGATSEPVVQTVNQ